MGVLQLFSDFYVQPQSGSRNPGDIYWVPVPELNEVQRIFDVTRASPTNHHEIEGQIRQIANHHFTNRPGRLPVKQLGLGATEELLIEKAKRRPVIVLFSSVVGDTATLAKPNLAKGVERPSYVVAPLFSIATLDSPGTFMPELVARIRALRYPHLACLPRLGSSLLEPGEVVRLDRLCVTHLGRGVRQEQVSLHRDITRLLIEQLQWCSAGTISEYLETVLETVQDCLPDNLK